MVGLRRLGSVADRWWGYCWRLPEIDEYRDLFSGYGDLTQVPEFTNAPPPVPIYWSGTEFAPTVAWLFFPDRDLPGIGDKAATYYAVAVRPGDVAAAMPEPQTLGLVGLALGLRKRPV